MQISLMLYLFQSTHPRRVWPFPSTMLSASPKFQSTHPRRVWLGVVVVAFQHLRVSIHTPTKGVTIYAGFAPYHLWCFNPHTHEGCDYLRWFRSISSLMFQSTHPRRVWQDCLICHISLTGFNPHTHEGCDVTYSSPKTHKIVSIHTPTKGVTLGNPAEPRRLEVSIHTPTKGVTSFIQQTAKIARFQSTHPRRVWHIGNVIKSYNILFQSTHPRRVWHSIAVLRHRKQGFNPHTHEGCDQLSAACHSPWQSFNPHTHEGCDNWVLHVVYQLFSFNPHTHEGCDCIFSK